MTWRSCPGYYFLLEWNFLMLTFQSLELWSSINTMDVPSFISKNRQFQTIISICRHFFIPRPSTFADSPVSVCRTVQFDTSPSTSLRWDLLLSNGFVINDFSRKKLKEVLRKHLEFWWVAISSFWFNVKKVKIIQTPRICQTHRDSSVQSSFASKRGNFTSHNHFQFEIPFFPHYTPRYEPSLTQVQK